MGRRINMGINKDIIKELSVFDIMGCSDLSDVIIAYTNFGCTSKFVNIQSGKRDTMLCNVIREGTRYVILCVGLINNERAGCISKYIPEYDVLLAAFYKLEIKIGEHAPCFSWSEDSRVIIGRDDAVVLNGPEDISSVFFEKYGRIVDLCGECIIADTAIHVLQMGTTTYFNIQGASGEEMRKFTKGVWLNYSPITFHASNYVFYLANAIHQTHGMLETGIKEFDMDGIETGEIQIPEYQDKVLRGCMWRCFNTCSERGIDAWSVNFIDGMEFGYLQNCNGEYVLRVLIVAAKGNMDAGSNEIPVRYMEIKRIHITEKILEHMHMLSVPLLYFDREGIDDGVFRYAKKYLEEAEAYTINILSDMHNPESKPGYIKDSMKTAFAVAYMPLFEKFLNMLDSNYKEAEDYYNKGKKFLTYKDSLYAHSRICKLETLMTILKNAVVYCCGDLKVELRKLVGEIYPDEKTLNQMLGIPRHLLNLQVQGKGSVFNFCDFETIKLFKAIFAGNKDYLMNMNKESVEKIITCFMNISYSCDKNHPFFVCLKMLIDIFGANNTDKYCDFMLSCYKELDGYAWLNIYSNYLKKVMVIGKSVTGLQWRLKGTELERADEAILPAYTILNDKKRYSKALQEFKKRHKDWTRYEYTDGIFSVTCPQGPTDIVEEGVKLNHCAKTFIESVASGKTTILFIRRVEKPLKPFYTIEVRNGRIRQCHGYDNCSADQCDGLIRFIKNFAKEKRLKINNNYNATLGADY